MTIKNQTITGSAVFDAPTITTPIDRFIASTSTQPGESLYNLKTTKP